MKQIIFLAISFFIYIGAFEVGKKIFGDGEFAIFFGAVAGGVCFWTLVTQLKDSE
jgi:hypothetical protein